MNDELESIVRQAMSFYVNDEQFGEEECVEIAVRNAVMKAASWQREQIEKQAVEGICTGVIDVKGRSLCSIPMRFTERDEKVKIVIIKQNRL